MIYITDGADTIYHHIVSSREVWGTATCADRALGREIVRAILDTGEFDAYGITYYPLEKVPEGEVMCAYCFGLLTEDPLPDDYPIGKDEIPNSLLTAIRQQLQHERDKKEE